MRCAGCRGSLPWSLVDMQVIDRQEPGHRRAFWEVGKGREAAYPPYVVWVAWESAVVF